MTSNPITPRRLGSFALLGGFVCLGLALASSCSKHSVLEPLAVTPAADGPVVAGEVLLQNNAHGVGLVVKLEPATNGVTATVRQTIEQSTAVRVLNAPREQAVTASGVRATVTDALGRYAFDGVEPGDYVVSTASRNYLAGSTPLRVWK